MDDEKVEEGGMPDLKEMVNAEGYIKSEFAMGPQALDQMCTLLGFDPSHDTQRIVIDIRADGLVQITHQEIVNQDKWNGLLAFLMGQEPLVSPDSQEEKSHNISNRNNKLMLTRQKRPPLRSKKEQSQQMGKFKKPGRR